MMGCESYDIPRDRRIIASIREEEPIRHQVGIPIRARKDRMYVCMYNFIIWNWQAFLQPAVVRF